MTAPQPPQPLTRRYPTDADYTADALSLAQAGWRVVSVQREPTGAIVATYAPIPTPVPAPTTPLSGPSTVIRHGLDMRWLIGGGVVGVVLLAVLACSLLSVFAAPTIGGAARRITSAAPTRSVNIAATVLANDPTATPGPSVTRVSGPHLGAPLSDFDAAFGPEQSSGVWHTTLSSQPVMIEVQTNTSGVDNPITTPDGLVRVWTLSIDYLAATPPTAAQNAAICRQFMPADAQHIHDDASVAPTVEHLYRSQMLAASFDVDGFQNNAGVNVAPGTFSIFYIQRACTMSTGQD